MTTEIYIENTRLDISNDLSALLTFELDNVCKFADRSTTWSKTIVLPGTANNNKQFGHIFQVGQSNFYTADLKNLGYNFNASKSVDCIIFQDQLQTFRGVLRLMQINMYSGRPEYEVAIFGQLTELNVKLSAALLEDLDFSAYDHVYNSTNAINSWDNAPGSAYYYPLIDYGTVSTGKHDWDIKALRPSLYVKEYIDKIMAAANFRYESALMDTDRFKRLVIPNNQKTLQKISTVIGQGIDTTTGRTVISDSTTDDAVVEQTLSASGTDFTYLAGVWTYTGATTKTFNIRASITGDYYSTIDTIRFELRKNGVFQSYIFPFLIPTFGTTDTNYSSALDTNITLSTGDTMGLYAKIANNVGSYRLRTNFVRFTINSQVPTLVDIAVGDTITITDTVPRNIKQIDFLTSIVKLFNLYLYEDRFDSRKIYIKPYIDFYSKYATNAVDWTYKLNRDKAVRVKPMSELTSKIYNFKYRPDGDYYNDYYKKQHNEGYGDYKFDSQYEFAEAENNVELIFSATPLVGYGGEEKVVPTIFKLNGAVEERVASNIRILQTKKITGVASWDIKNGASVLASVTDYGYGGHLDDPDAPANDLNFGTVKELFFVLLSGNLTNNQFNLYWSAYMAEITDKDSKLMSANFYLTPKDILELDFSKFVLIDGVLFRLNSITDYNVTTPMDTAVSLLKVNFLIY